MKHFILSALVVSVGLLSSSQGAERLEWLTIPKGKAIFVKQKSKQRFVPWGFNYDHDPNGRLLEDYWDREWDRVVEDFGEMKSLGANVARIHLQLGKFMVDAIKPNESSLKQLGRLVKLAEKTGLYLDVTGLGCYHKKDVPLWYDKLGEKERWQVQARFWQAVAGTCSDSPAIFCYDLMNEPVVPGGKKRDEWLGPAFAGKHFVQFITLDIQKRKRPEVALAWTRFLCKAIRKVDSRHLITVGLVPWSLDRPGLTSGFVPEKISEPLDFISVHLYPDKGKVKEAIATLKGFAIGKPVVIEETFPLRCSLKELEAFLEQSRGIATGWIGFYWGTTVKELEKPKTIPEAITKQWLELFQRKKKAMQSGK